ncbi:LacI family DNA-binding transcriptional regulator [Paenibacillus sp. MBLB4367]|uniref:LacI family DNA-binding transcriptional regulator n=1 Tax=Paenibacillus sp. MBLB4367 TaxID=3384767 RepID=UPI0039080AFA
MSITSKEIAEICGVSRGTVDRALNNRPGVNEATKQKVLETARQLGYRPHFLAQSLVRGRTMSIGAVIFDINNQLFPQLIHAVESRAREAGYFLNLTLTNKNPDIEKECLHHLADRKMDGIILLSVNTGATFEQFIQKLNIPVVTFGNRISGTVPHVWIDDRKAVRDAVTLLAAKGYEEIIYVCPPLSLRGQTNVYAVEQRFAGFQDALEQASHIRSHVIDHKGYVEEIEGRLKANGRRKAIFCTSDKYALNIWLHLKKKGIRVPADAGLMGFDNIETLKYMTPSLSTVSYSLETIGNRLIDCLIGRIEGREVPPTTLVEHQIIKGESC